MTTKRFLVERANIIDQLHMLKQYSTLEALRSRELSLAITHIEEALHWLEHTE